MDLDAFVVGSDAFVTGIDAHFGSEVSITDFDALAGSESPVISADTFDADRELQKIVDDVFNPPPSASFGRFLTSRLTRQAKRKLMN